MSCASPTISPVNAGGATPMIVDLRRRRSMIVRPIDAGSFVKAARPVAVADRRRPAHAPTIAIRGRVERRARSAPERRAPRSSCAETKRPRGCSRPSPRRVDAHVEPVRARPIASTPVKTWFWSRRSRYSGYDSRSVRGEPCECELDARRVADRDELLGVTSPAAARMSTASISVKIAVFAPMPIASAPTMTAVKPTLRRSVRSAYTRSCCSSLDHIRSMHRSLPLFVHA